MHLLPIPSEDAPSVEEAREPSTLDSDLDAINTELAFSTWETS